MKRKKASPTKKAVISFRPRKFTRALLERAMEDKPVLSKIIDDCIRKTLTVEYGRKSDDWEFSEE